MLKPVWRRVSWTTPAEATLGEEKISGGGGGGGGGNLERQRWDQQSWKLPALATPSAKVCHPEGQVPDKWRPKRVKSAGWETFPWIWAAELGLTVNKVNVNAVTIHATVVVDSGAEVSIWSTYHYYSSPSHQRPRLSSSLYLTVADCTQSLPAEGVVFARIEIQDLSFTWRVHVAPIADLLLLGSDVLDAQDITVSSRRGLRTRNGNAWRNNWKLGLSVHHLHPGQLPQCWRGTVMVPCAGA